MFNRLKENISNFNLTIQARYYNYKITRLSYKLKKQHLKNRINTMKAEEYLLAKQHLKNERMNMIWLSIGAFIATAVMLLCVLN